MAMYIYTDGAASNNGSDDSLGGYSVVLMDGLGHVLDCYSQTNIPNVTNNQMELTALLASVVLYGHCSKANVCYVYTDSNYAKNCITDWWFTWVNNGWKTSAGLPVKNQDLIKEYIKLAYRANSIFDAWKWNVKHISAHHGEFGNEIADKLATGELSCEEVMKRYGKKETN